MAHTYKNITVFCSASGAVSSFHHKPMRELGELLASKGITMVFGIGDNGLMGSVFQGVRNKNGRVIGITTQKLLELQCKDQSVFKKGEIQVVKDLTERKMRMFDECDAIIVGPGGWGTIDEFSEFAVRIQTGEIKRKPMVFFSSNRFWAPLETLILDMLQEGVLNQDKVDYVEFVENVEDIFPALEKVQNRLDAKAKGCK